MTGMWRVAAAAGVVAVLGIPAMAEVLGRLLSSVIVVPALGVVLGKLMLSAGFSMMVSSSAVGVAG